ncbi:S8 family serine peptidase [bacterium 3DAC]|nr:S8 family serine peptidase [bacterium 3DAC]
MRRKFTVVLIALTLVLSSFVPTAYAGIVKSQPQNVGISVSKQIISNKVDFAKVAAEKINKGMLMSDDEISPDTKVYFFLLPTKDNQDINALVKKVEKAVPSAKIVYHYKYVLKGVGGYVPYKDAPKLQLIAGKVGLRFVIGKKHTIQAWPVSDQPNMAFSTKLVGSDVANAEGYTGKGTVVMIIDTGIRPDHEFFYKDGTEPKPCTPWKDLIGPDKKFIGGYDFSDNDDDPTIGTCYQSPNVSPHGTHVAGTVAGVEGHFNGLTLHGVAPDAQLYIAKVFSGPYAYESAIVAAIDKSVELKKEGVNIVAANMSLGSTYGMDDPNDPEQKAIQNAIKAGISYAIAAGNENHFLAGSVPLLYDSIYPLNISRLGSPASTPEAITVAASNNAARAVTGFKLSATVSVNGKEVDRVPYLVSPDSPDPVKVITGTVALAVADPKNLTACNANDLVDLTGKVALIKRGGCYFSTKVLNAKAHGAIGVVIWNHESGGDTFVSMALGNAKNTIPAVFIWNSYGKALNDALASGKNIEIKFDGKQEIVPMNVNELADFSSWGTVPSLLVKPDISAPGLAITSAVASSPDAYATSSGTSMAAPHVAGAVALLKQAYPDATPAQIKEALMNHAQVMFSKNKPWQISPRKQGAGRLDIPAAIKYFKLTLESYGFPNDKFNGQPSVSLGVIDKLPVSFKIKVHNGTDQAIDATVGLLAFSGIAPYDVGSRRYGFIDSATVTADTDHITLQPGEDKIITVTVQDVPYVGWVEGHLSLYAGNEEIGTIPFAGLFDPNGPYYYGDGWKNGANPTVDWPWWSQSRYLDYWGRKYGESEAIHKGWTGLWYRYYTYKVGANGQEFDDFGYLMPLGIADYQAVAAKFGFYLFEPTTGYNAKWAGAPMTYVEEAQGATKTVEITDIIVNFTKFRAVVKYDAEVINTDTGTVVAQYSTGDMWSGVMRMGWGQFRNDPRVWWENAGWIHVNDLNNTEDFNLIVPVGTKLDEGQYEVKLYVYPRPVINPFNKNYDYKPQVVTMPFKVDRTAPEAAVTLDMRMDNTIKVFYAGDQDKLTGLVGYNFKIVPNSMPDDASRSYFFVYAPATQLPYTIDLSKLSYYTKDGNKKYASIKPEDIKYIVVMPEDGAHNINQTGFAVGSVLNKDFIVGGGYSLVASDGSYNITPKAYFGADEVYKIEGGKIKEVKGKVWNEFVPNLVDASKDTSVVANEVYLIRRDNPGYVATIATKGYNIMAKGVQLKTVNGMAVVQFSKDVKISDLKADANIVKIYELYSNGSQIKSYYEAPSDDFVFQSGHTYLLIFDNDTTITLGN